AELRYVREMLVELCPAVANGDVRRPAVDRDGLEDVVVATEDELKQVIPVEGSTRLLVRFLQDRVLLRDLELAELLGLLVLIGFLDDIHDLLARTRVQPIQRAMAEQPASPRRLRVERVEAAEVFAEDADLVEMLLVL